MSKAPPLPPTCRTNPFLYFVLFIAFCRVNFLKEVLPVHVVMSKVDDKKWNIRCENDEKMPRKCILTSDDRTWTIGDKTYTNRLPMAGLTMEIQNGEFFNVGRHQFRLVDNDKYKAEFIE